jgi:hypothetical protein
MVVPVITPVTTPVVAFTGATAGVLLAHVPPETEWDKLVVNPAHTVNAPMIGGISIYSKISGVTVLKPVTAQVTTTRYHEESVTVVM